MEMVKGIRTFIFPGDEQGYESLANDDSVSIVNKVITPCPKEGMVIYVVEYEQYK